MTLADFFAVLFAGFGIMVMLAVLSWYLEKLTRNE